MGCFQVGFQPLLACRIPGCELAAHQSEIKVEDDERGQEECWLVKHFSGRAAGTVKISNTARGAMSFAGKQ